MEKNRKSANNVRALREKFERQSSGSPEEQALSRSNLTKCSSQTKLSAQICSLSLKNDDDRIRTVSPSRISTPVPLPSVLPTRILKPRPFSFSEATESGGGSEFSFLSPEPEKPPRTFLYDLFSDPPPPPLSSKQRQPPSYEEASDSIIRRKQKQPLTGTRSLPKFTDNNANPHENRHRSVPVHRKPIYISDFPITLNKRKKKIKPTQSVPNHSRGEDSEFEDESALSESLSIQQQQSQIDESYSASSQQSQTMNTLSSHRISLASIRPIIQVSSNNNSVQATALTSPPPPQSRLLRAKTESDITTTAHSNKLQHQHEYDTSESQRRPLRIPPTTPFSSTSNQEFNPYYYPHGLTIGPNGSINRTPLPPDHPNHSCVGILQTFQQFFESEYNTNKTQTQDYDSNSQLAVTQYVDFITQFHPELAQCDQPALFYRQGTSVTVVPPREQPLYVNRMVSTYPYYNYLPPIIPEPKYGTTAAVLRGGKGYRPRTIEELTKSKSDWNLNSVGDNLNTFNHQNERIESHQQQHHHRPPLPNKLSRSDNVNAVKNGRHSNENFLQAKAVFNNGNSDHNFINHNHTHHRPRAMHHQSINNLVNQMYPVNIEGVRKDATSSTDSGIQIGTDSLSSCDTPLTGDSTTDTGDSDCENEVGDLVTSRQVIEERKGYIRRVSSIRATELQPLQRLLFNNHHFSEPISRVEEQHGKSNGRVVGALFDNLLIIGIQRDERTGAYHPFIKYKYPPSAALPDGIERFCFPDSLEWPCHEGSTAQFYTLTITQSDGSRKYGCCYRILPDGANICIPIAYCIISQTRAIGFYRNVLQILASRHGYSESQMNFLINDLHDETIPVPGKNLLIQDPISALPTNSIDYGMAVPLIIRRKADVRLESTDLYVLLTSLDVSTVLKLFGSLLLERKIVLLSRHLNLLSLCVEALESMLYPFSWQHTFVPILPLNMNELLDVPAPFVIGVLRSQVVPWDIKLDEGIVVDLDQRKILSSVGDEGTILPKRLHKKLRDALLSVQNILDQTENTKNVLISECFIRIFVETLGHYRTNGLFDVSALNQNHDEKDSSSQRIFKKELFLKSVSSKSNRDFLDWFTETSMFQQFIEYRKNSTFRPGLFEQRCVEQLESHHKDLNYQNGNTAWKNSNILSKGTAWLKGTFSGKERD